MNKKMNAAPEFIAVTRSREHNLKGISLRVPLQRLTLVCGVSGSGKSTLANDVLFREGQGRYLESFSAYARRFQARLNRSQTEAVDPIPPALALGQRLSLNNPRSTVATLTDLLSPIRMLFSRFSHPARDGRVTRSHLSFNHSLGACPHCQGLGQVHEIDPEKLVRDPGCSLRRGALSLSTPNGYIIYSQVTIDVLDQVCRAHGFSVDIPWNELSVDQQRVVFYGSDRVQVPFGKHPLESRLRWTGITPKPREMGTYRGILPIMEEILRRGPNPNILRYCRRRPCHACNGLRLADRFLGLAYHGTPLRRVLSFTIAELADWGERMAKRPRSSRPEALILSGLTAQARLLQGLSLGHLALQRAVPTLSRSEGQRIQIGNLLRNPISGMLYVIDEPGSGLHPREKIFLYRKFRELLAIGSTVVMVSHDRQALAFADWVIELGPVGGAEGGHLLFCGSTREYLAARGGARSPETEPPGRSPAGAPMTILAAGPLQNNTLVIPRLEFPSPAIIAVSGLSGSGKSSLLEWLGKKGPAGIQGETAFSRVMIIDQQPLGKNSRSNPATYTKLFNDIRKLFAVQPGARELGLSASSFSFNTGQGCCGACQGSGAMEITMHYLEPLYSPCPQCQGRRYQDRVLGIRYRGLAIDDVLNLTIAQALEFFAGEHRITARLQILSDLGLDYLTLGQPSSTLSGGEAQRVRLASFIQDHPARQTLYLLDEPCQGLHDRDIPCLLHALGKLRAQGATLIVAENNPLFIAGCDWLIELSPAGASESSLFFSGRVADIHRHQGSLVAAMLAAGDPVGSGGTINRHEPDAGPQPAPCIHMRGVRTHNLRNVSVTIPEGAFTVVGGPTGSGKSSLILDTLYKACQQRYAEHLSPYLRDRLALAGGGDCDGIDPVKPAVALAARYLEATPRSTVGTLSGINDMLRVLFSRAGSAELPAGFARLHASHFSFNHQDGACPACGGLGHVVEADASRWLVAPGKPMLQGAFSGEKACHFFLDPRGRHMATLQSAARELELDVGANWRDLSPEARAMVLEGCAGDFVVTWKFKRGQRSGEHRFTSPWIGLNRLIVQDYLRRKEHRDQGERYAAVVYKKTCPSCRGLRLRDFSLRSRVGAVSLEALLTAPLTGLRKRVAGTDALFPGRNPSAAERLVCREVLPALNRHLDSLIQLGIGYLTLGRAVDSLSSGEHQRLRLASLLANRLNFTLFILDEISRGLHPFDVANLLGMLRRLLSGGNTVVAVDQHPLVAAQADWTIRLGPGSGRQGGQVVGMGRDNRMPPVDLVIAPPGGAAPRARSIIIAGARIHNLDGLDLAIPAQGLTVLCGVSGSGKSTLLHRVIRESAVAGRPIHCAALNGLEAFATTVSFSAANASRGGGAKFRDFLGISTPIFAAFTSSVQDPTQRSQLKKMLAAPAAVSLCSHCQGEGEWTTDLDYMGTFAETCPHCRGSGFSTELSGLQLHGMTLAELLAGDMAALPDETVAACRLQKVISGLNELSLAYLNPDRKVGTLSAGEYQRLRLAHLFLNLKKSPSLLLLDEPDSGLSPDECRQLIRTLKGHLAKGHAAIVISHHPLMMAQADYLIDLGPGAGEEGGRVTASGSPQEIVAGNWPLSRTAAYLKQLFSTGKQTQDARHSNGSLTSDV